MPEPLEYACPPLEPLPHSQLGSDSLLLTFIWLGCFVLTLLTLALSPYFAVAIGVMTLMAMLVFIPLAFVLALLGIGEMNCRRTCAYVGAAVNGGVLLAGLILVGWDRLL